MGLTNMTAIDRHSAASPHAGGALLEACPTLREIYTTGMSVSAGGERMAVHSNLPIETADALYRTVRAQQPGVVVEIGMAFGASSLAILSGLSANGDTGRLISIDPNQTAQWKRAGVAAVERAGYADRHTLVELPDYVALPRLLAEGQRVDFAFIDGWHTFDYTLLDFWYLDRMVPVGGMVAFDDCWFPAVHKAIAFVLSHRRYEEVDAGLSRATENLSGLSGLGKRLIGLRMLNEWRRMTGRQVGMYTPYNRYLRKTDDWEPAWNFFADF